MQAKVAEAGATARAELETQLQAVTKEQLETKSQLEVTTTKVKALEREHDTSVAAKERVKQQMSKKIADFATKVS